MSKLIVLIVSIFYIQLSFLKDDIMVNMHANISSESCITDTTIPKSFLALGDSYTIGEAVSVSERFPMQTVKYLQEQGINFSEPEIIAKTGWMTGNLLNAIATQAPSKQPYDIVTLLIGVNNQYKHQSQQQYADEFLTLLNKAIQYAGNNKKRVIVLSIPDYSVTPFASGSDKALIAKEIDAFNAINKTIAQQAGVNYLDITAYTRMAATDAGLVATDGLHPSGREYKAWAEALLPVIKVALQ